MASPFETNGAFSWLELMTTDPKAAERFYSQLLGWQLEPMPMGEMTYTVVKAPGQEMGMGGIMKMPKEVPPGVPPHWGVYVTVADADAAAKKAVELGGKVHVQPRDIPDVGRFAVLADPQGATFMVIQYKMKKA